MNAMVLSIVELTIALNNTFTLQDVYGAVVC